MGPGISEASKRCVECVFLRTPGCELGGGREGPIGLGLGSVDTPRISIGPAGTGCTLFPSLSFYVASGALGRKGLHEILDPLAWLPH